MTCLPPPHRHPAVRGLVARRGGPPPWSLLLGARRGGRPPWPLLLLVALVRAGGHGPRRLRRPLPATMVLPVRLPRVPRLLTRLVVVAASAVLLGVVGAVVAVGAPSGGVVPLPVVPRGAYGWPIGPDRGVTAGAVGPPARPGDDGSVTRRFRAPPHPYGRGHRGVDLAGSPGESVRAAGAGTVVFAGRVAGRGVVSVEHGGGLRTTYEPVTAAVAVGTPVARGSPLGALEPGHAGCPVVSCLHWGLRRAGPGGLGGPADYLDPLLLLGLGRVRLLPLDE